MVDVARWACVHELRLDAYCDECDTDAQRAAVPPCALGHTACGTPDLCGMFGASVFSALLPPQPIPLDKWHRVYYGTRDRVQYAACDNPACVCNDWEPTHAMLERKADAKLAAKNLVEVVREVRSQLFESTPPVRREAVTWPVKLWHYGGPYGAKQDTKAGWYSLPNPPQGYPAWLRALREKTRLACFFY